ncbi:hypothetical protein [Devosia sp.]|uniref:hypothetical protein n=1 Tax=Devosia sp. TaxID=1871048 RepID=UPI003A912106
MLLADSPAGTHVLDRFARHVGFTQSGTPGRSLADVALEVPIFFFVHQGMPDALLTATIRWVRSHHQPVVQYAPIIVIARDGPAEETLKYVHMGCDDVIVMPEEPEVLVSRLKVHVTEEQIYFETPTYLGPDRRRMEAPRPPRDERRDASSSAHRRLTIRRVPGHGVFVLKSERFGDDGQPVAYDPEAASANTETVS